MFHPLEMGDCPSLSAVLSTPEGMTVHNGGLAYSELGRPTLRLAISELRLPGSNGDLRGRRRDRGIV